MKQKIVITGGSGFLGRYFQERFTEDGYEVIIIGRKEKYSWKDLPAVLEGATAVINLAGKSVDCRYTEANKAAIISSRVDTTKQVAAAIKQCAHPPKIWLNASSATYYPDSYNNPQVEGVQNNQRNFSEEVVHLWEQALFAGKLPQTKRIALRISLVLGKTGGVIIPYKNLVRFGLGGKQGSGKQMFSWIHIEDIYRICKFLLAHSELEGVINCATLYPITNKVFMQSMRKSMHMPFGLPAPRFLLEMGAKIIGTETELILKSRYVLPKRLLDAGFKFTYPNIQEALREILN